MRKQLIILLAALLIALAATVMLWNETDEEYFLDWMPDNSILMWMNL